MPTCRYCGGEVAWSNAAGGWLHAEPLARLRVTHQEAREIYADPPHRKQVLHRATVLHQAQAWKGAS